ncbi:MAG TPA: ELM1/GtrOC1 family putative glycosyltransferase [Dongiaceae bacterium]|nr:ELM1/GtrOC1 family putative glycosyltransferase [Dongiaceae bacterium]
MTFGMLIKFIDVEVGESHYGSAVAPYIWAMTEGRVGDDRQVLALADALGGRVQQQHITDSLAKIVAGRLFNSIGLHAPWHRRQYRDCEFPDLMIAAGGRCAALARWVKQASGGKTKVVIVGRPWARLDDFDLVVTTPQYALPKRANVLRNVLPLNRVDRDRLADATAVWADRFAALPRPWTGVLIGGDSGSFRFTDDCARDLRQRLNALAGETDGSLLISTSARTPQHVVDALADLHVPHHLHIWRPRQAENPYAAIIGLSDKLIVSSESASMIAEAVNSGKPVELFHPEERLLSRLLTRGPKALGLKWLMQLGPYLGYWTPPRDMRRLHRALARHGARMAQIHNMQAGTVDRDLLRTVVHIRRLLVAPAPQMDELAVPAFETATP